MRRRDLSIVRRALPAVLALVLVVPRVPGRVRGVAAGALVAFWSVVYAHYRRGARRRTRLEFERLRATDWSTYTRHYNEQVPTIEEEFELWGPYHQHRHEMRYDLVASAVDRYLPDGGLVLDVGCGSASVADRILHRRATYVGLDFGGHHIAFAAKKLRDSREPLQARFGRADAATLPIAEQSADVVVMSEVIEHLLRPELAVWEVARVLRGGGVFVMTTNNASEAPLRSPLSHLFLWIERAIGTEHPSVVSMRPWVWPHKMSPDIVPDGLGDVWLPHTHHIPAETRQMFSAAGLEMLEWRTFEFPPPQSATAARLDRMGESGRTLVDLIEAVAQRTPLVRRLGTHLFMVARKVADPVAAEPPPGTWPGPFSRG